MVSLTTTLISLLPVIATLTTGITATPMANNANTARQASGPDYVTATFIGAADAQYTLQIPVSSTWTPTNNPLSISHISTTANGEGQPCVFFGTEGAVFVSGPGGGFGDVGPPQPIAGGICGPFPGEDYGMW